MKYERTIKTLQKAGFRVKRGFRDCTAYGKPGEIYEWGFIARLPGSHRRIDATRQNDEVCTMRVIRDNDHDDSQSDYCAGTWVETIKRAIFLASKD